MLYFIIIALYLSLISPSVSDKKPKRVRPIVQKKLPESDPLYTGYAPREDLLLSGYVNEYDEHDTLFLTTGDPALNFFFLITRDSNNQSIMLRGKWIYDGFFVKSPKDTAILIFFPWNDAGGWKSRVTIYDEITKYNTTRTLILDTLMDRRPNIWQTKFNASGHPFRFKRIVYYY